MSINAKGLVLNKFKYDETKDNLSNLYFHFPTFLYLVLLFEKLFNDFNSL